MQLPEKDKIQIICKYVRQWEKKGKKYININSTGVAMADTAFIKNVFSKLLMNKHILFLK